MAKVLIFSAFALAERQLLAYIKPRALPWAMFSPALQAGIMTSNCKYRLCKSLF